ncbi:MAG TPA: oxalurate catabolism protein HpxZ [Burkholderiales bacterium]|jgi:ketosteroid isomerase-like protein|nr:oxalurate catabolism protein HpxZ [Burkholderiales bacterium]
MEINIPEVLAEVSAAFERYEAALNANDVAVLDASFWPSPHTVRYGLAENLYGRDEILAFRRGRPPADVQRRKLLRVSITTYGRDAATASCEFLRPESNRRGRQTQTWMRTPEGWRVVNAHVSWFTPPGAQSS